MVCALSVDPSFLRNPKYFHSTDLFRYTPNNNPVELLSIENMWWLLVKQFCLVYGCSCKKWAFHLILIKYYRAYCCPLSSEVYTCSTSYRMLGPVFYLLITLQIPNVYSSYKLWVWGRGGGAARRHCYKSKGEQALKVEWHSFSGDNNCKITLSETRGTEKERCALGEREWNESRWVGKKEKEER